MTSPLTEALWFCLLGSLQTIRETTGLESRLRVAHTNQQPEALGLAENDEHSIGIHADFITVTYQQTAQASHWINRQQAPLVIQVNEQTSLSQLFDNIHIISEQKAHFERRQSQLQKALTSGKPVVLRGLESNPILQQLLEPLAVGQPLLVNGQLQTYPKAHVTLLWPESAKSPSSVWSSMIATGKPCPAIDIWDISGDRHDIPRTELPEQALHILYEAFKTVPPHLCNPLPEMTEGLLNNLILAARRAQQVDQSPQLLPRHWRKGINSVITHGTRQNQSVRDFMKVACWQLMPDDVQTASADPDRLNAIINSALRLDREFVKQNLWPLARAFEPSLFNEELQLSYASPFSRATEKESLDRLCAMIVAQAPEQQRAAIAYQLAVDPAATEPYQHLAIRPSGQIKRVEDALTSGWHLPLPSGQTRSDTILALTTDCFYIARTANSEAAGIEYIANRLSESLEWTGSTDKPLLALARDLYHGEMSQQDRESRRLSRLHDRLVDSPVIFLQGETGTGKSYFSARMAKASGQASVISLGPSDSEQTLMKRWQWHKHGDSDRSMELQNRALMEWARTSHDNDGEYVTLILDEANLAKTGLLASLNGLWEPKEPCIYVSGHPVKVSSKHRVILTGNPDYYAGRQLDPALKEKLPRAYYPRLDRAFLSDRVVEPALARQLQRHLPEPQINDIAHSATECVMTLWQYYQELLPEHEFTPRDLTDICSWLGWYLDRALRVNDTVTGRQINGLIQQSFQDVLGPEISETYQDALTALEIWFAARYEPDNTLSDKVRNQTTLYPIKQAFKEFTEKTRPDFDTSGSAVHQLVQRLGQDLSRCQQAYHLDRKHDGRQATLIEGPAGRGKDATLNLVIESVKRQAEQRGESMPEVFLLNACDCSWDKVCEKIQTAKVHGVIVVISEMNLIDSQHLEGELNDILAGDAHPGFHLFATINPPKYSGRKPLSPALKGRFRHLPIRQYNPAELQAIAEKVLPDNPQGKILAEQLTKKHCLLRACLQQKKLPLQPTSLDLQNVARAVIRGGDFTEEGLHQCLNQHYRLYLMAAKISLEKLPESSALAVSKDELDSGLCKWFSQTVSGKDRPWLIRRSDLNSIDEKRHEIRINTRLSDEEARTEIIKRVAQARWQASGLSLKPDLSDDILTQALYRHWQQRWFDHEFGQTGVEASDVFFLTEEEEETLKISANQTYLREADARISAWNFGAVQLWPAFWHQLSDLLNHLVDDYINEASAVDTDNAPEQYIPEVLEKEAPALDQETGYESEEKPKINDYVIFDWPNHFPGIYRWWAEDVYVSAEGHIKLININDRYMLGAEVLVPAQLPGRDQELTLARDQTLATLNISSHNGQYTLPSLTANDYIVALRIESGLSFTLVRDRYTGLHTLSIPEARPQQCIQVAYVVEPADADKKTPAREVRPAHTTRFDARCSEGTKAVLKSLFETIGQQPTELQVPLEAIQNAKNTVQRIKAIANYCRTFSGNAQPESSGNFFKFLVTQRQGSCRHRVPVFIAFCRYFGIPCRQISNRTHAFAECSVDRGQTWVSVDLGGAPVEATEILSDFQLSRRVSGSGTQSKKIRDLLKGADLAQQQALAEASGISLEELNNALETDSSLPKIKPSTYLMIRRLWERGDLPGFSVGVSMLLEAETLSYREKQLIGTVLERNSPVCRPMSKVVTQILANSDEDQVTEPLKSLHSKRVVQSGERNSALQWLSSIADILTESDLTRPSVIRFAHKALESGWLDPLPTYQRLIIEAIQHHELLSRLESIDELKVKATHCLKMWYTGLLSKEKNSQIWRSAYRRYQWEISNAFFVTHCHDGFSPLLEDKMLRSSLQSTWTDEPEGIPNIERMLVHHPAFVQSNSGKANHRPVIILGPPFWFCREMNEKVEALLKRKVEDSPSLKPLLEKIKPESLEASDEDKRLLDSLKQKCEKAIQQAFCHYLYEVTHSKGGCLTYCWGDVDVYKYGAHDPSSAGELYTMMFEICSSPRFQNSFNDDYLREAQNASDALILTSNDLTMIVEEFLNSMNLNSLCESLDT
ncbi:AAA family ATPase [Endozoicomonas sp. SESOKO3]|uniref:AAA family ATPase n=1 Tax=Endozoicomonas sp. SESOKO3 TaxID=2828744 RepID=UPI002147C44D